ncbi:MAG TPA: site-specific DNA-methyltransferase [Gammaproteobacteria bacterium]|nr:site-specific DNA-methyltransferase [Gammaproteobacteria bacterium]
MRAHSTKEPGTWAGPNGRSKSPHSQGFGQRSKEQEAERQDKQRGHGRRHNGFNDRWDAMTQEEQCNVMRNKRNVWTVGTHPYPGAHFAVFPADLIEPCVLAGSRSGDVVLDPFMGSGTTAQVAEHLGRQWIGCELNADYLPLQANRLSQRAMAL